MTFSSMGLLIYISMNKLISKQMNRDELSLKTKNLYVKAFEHICAQLLIHVAQANTHFTIVELQSKGQTLSKRTFADKHCRE